MLNPLPGTRGDTNYLNEYLYIISVQYKPIYMYSFNKIHVI